MKKHIAFVAAVLMGCTSCGTSAQTHPAAANPWPGINLGLDELKAQYKHYYAYRRLKPKKWPNGARLAVALSFDIDNSTPTLARGTPGSEPMSRGQYGAVDGLPRILRVLDKENVPASFFVPAVSAALNPEMIPEIQSKKRHEIGIHGWIHENLVELNDAAKEQQLLNQSIELLTKAMGKKPVGGYSRAILGDEPLHDEASEGGGLPLRQQSHGERRCVRKLDRRQSDRRGGAADRTHCG